MKRLADDVWQLPSFPPNSINAYLVGDVLVDAQTRHAGGRILRGHAVSAHVLTHAHADHQGASHAVCEQLGIPLWVGTRDADAAEDPRLMRERMPSHPMPRLYCSRSSPACTRRGASSRPTPRRTAAPRTASPTSRPPSPCSVTAHRCATSPGSRRS